MHGWNDGTMEENNPPTFFPKYRLHEIYNADEFGWLFRIQPENLLNLQDHSRNREGKQQELPYWIGGIGNRWSEACTRGNHCKIWLTEMVVAKVMGCRLKVFVIGKFKSPRWFKGAKNLLSRYRNKKSCIVAFCLKNGNKKWIANLLKKNKDGSCHR